MTKTKQSTNQTMSNEFRQYYTMADAVNFFRGIGFRVELKTVTRYACNESWETKVWQIQNPHTGEWTDMNACYRDIRELGTNRAWQTNLNKLDIINYFKNKE